MRATSASKQDAPMTSAVSWALLGLVISSPGYGLEFARRFEQTYGDVLELSGDSHVYLVLARLQKLGLIERFRGPRAGRQSKPHYRATALGCAAIRIGWSSRPTRSFVARSFGFDSSRSSPRHRMPRSR